MTNFKFVSERSAWKAQYAALCKQRFILAFRSWKTTAAQLLMGAFICGLLVVFQWLSDSVLSNELLHPPTVQIGPIPRCIPASVSVRANADGTLTRGGCNTVLFAPNTPGVERLLRRVALNSGLDYTYDFVPLPGRTDPSNVRLANASTSNSTFCDAGLCDSVLPPAPECLPCAIIQDNATLASHILAYPNSTQTALWVFGAYQVLVPDVSYAILYNYTATGFPFLQSSRALELQRGIQQALLELAVETTWNASSPAGQGPPPVALFNYTVQQRSFPRPPPRLSGYDVFAANGGQWLFVVPALTFFHVLTELVHEKEAKLRVGMRQMGLQTSAFWAAWMTYGFTLATVNTAVMQASGFLAGFDFFTNSAFMATLLLFYTFSLSMVALAMLLSAVLSSSRTAQTVGYSIILIGFLLQFIITSAYAGILDLMYAEETFPLVVALRYLLQLYPAFNFSKWFYDISMLSASTVSATDGKLTRGPGFHWSDMNEYHVRSFLGFQCDLPPASFSLFIQLGNTLLFVLLALYLDAVLPGPHGSPSPPCFCCGSRGSKSKTPTLGSSSSGSGGAAAAQSGGRPTAPRPGTAGEEDDPITDVGVLAETAFAETAHTVPTSVLRGQQQGSGPAGQNPRARWRSGTGAGAPIVLRVSHLRVVYRKGGAALFHALTGRELTELRAADIFPAWVLRALGALGTGCSWGGGSGARGQQAYSRMAAGSDASETNIGPSHGEQGAEGSQQQGGRRDSEGGTPSTGMWPGAAASSIINNTEEDDGASSVVASGHAPPQGGGGPSSHASPRNSTPWHARMLGRLFGVSPPGTAPSSQSCSGACHPCFRCPGYCRRRRRRASETGTAGGGGGESGVVAAVRDLSLTLRKGECLGILGHNGCGKTSTISVLTGLFGASGGSAEACGFDVSTQIADVQRIMGVCPQQDLLWPLLTAWETLELFAAIKGVPQGRERVEEVTRVLREVRLQAVAHRAVGTFSGGMKRRVSVAIAALGSPAILFLDEPTTGMDPVNRLQVWRLIQRLKRSASIILTTHNMEECGTLGDRVAIMAGGRLVALGTPLRLKARYGAGYRLSLVLQRNSDAAAAAVVAGVTALAPAAALALRDASSITIVVPFSSIGSMPAVLDWVDSVCAPSGRGEPEEGGRDIREEGQGEPGGGAGATGSIRLDAFPGEGGWEGGGAAEAGGILGDPLGALETRAPPPSAPPPPPVTQPLGASTPTPRPPPLVREYGVSGPTLESVFIAVSAHAKFDLAQSALEDTGHGGSGGHAPAPRGGEGGSRGPGGSTTVDGAVGAPLDGPPPSSSPPPAPAPGNSRGTGTTSPPSSSGSVGGGSDRGSSSSSAGSGGVTRGNGASKPPRCFQHRALLRKNLTLLLRQRGLFACQVITPLAVLGLLLMLQYIIRVELGGSVASQVPMLLLPLNMNQLLGNARSHMPQVLGRGDPDRLQRGARADDVPAPYSSPPLALGGGGRPDRAPDALAQSSSDPDLFPGGSGEWGPRGSEWGWAPGDLALRLHGISLLSGGGGRGPVAAQIPFPVGVESGFQQQRFRTGPWGKREVVAELLSLLPAPWHGGLLLGGLLANGPPPLIQRRGPAPLRGDSSGISAAWWWWAFGGGDRGAAKSTLSHLSALGEGPASSPVTADEGPTAEVASLLRADAPGTLAAPSGVFPPQQPPSLAIEQAFKGHGDDDGNGTAPQDPLTNCVEFFVFSVSPDGTPGSGDNGPALQGAVGTLPRQYAPAGYNSSVSAADDTDAGGLLWPPPLPPLPPHPYPHNGTGLLGRIRVTWCIMNNGTAVLAPFFDPRNASDGSGGGAGMDRELMRDLKLLNNVTMDDTQRQPPCVYNATTGRAEAEDARLGAWLRNQRWRELRAAHGPKGVRTLLAALRASASALYRAMVISPARDADDNAGRAAWASPHATPSPSRSPLPYDADTERWLCPAYLLPDAAVEFFSLSLPSAVVSQMKAEAALSSSLTTSALAAGERRRRVLSPLTPLEGEEAGEEERPQSVHSAPRIRAPVRRPPGSTSVLSSSAPSPAAVTCSFAVSLQVNDNSIVEYHRPSNFSRSGLSFAQAWQSAGPSLIVDPARMSLLDMLWRGYAASAGYNMSLLDELLPSEPHANAPRDRVSAPPVPVIPPFTIASVAAVGNMPYVVVTNTLQLVEIIGALLHPITLTLQLPLFVFVTVLEKEERLVELQRAMGLKYNAYWVVNYGLNFAVYCVVAGMFWGAGAALEFTFFAQTSPVVMGVMLVGWGLSLCSMAMLISAFLWSRKTATIVGYVIALFGNLLAILIAAGVYGFNGTNTPSEPMPPWLYIVPIVGLVRFLFLGSFQCIALVHCISDVRVLVQPGEIRLAVWSLYACAVVYLLLALYLDQVLPRPYGVSKHPLWFLLPDEAIAVVTTDAAAAAAGDKSTPRHHGGDDAALPLSTDHRGGKTPGPQGSASPHGGTPPLGDSPPTSTWGTVLRGRWKRLWGAARLGLARFLVPPPSARELQRRHEQAEAVAQLLLLSGTPYPGGSGGAGGSADLAQPLLLRGGSARTAGDSEEGGEEGGPGVRGSMEEEGDAGLWGSKGGERHQGEGPLLPGFPGGGAAAPGRPSRRTLPRLTISTVPQQRGALEGGGSSVLGGTGLGGLWRIGRRSPSGAAPLHPNTSSGGGLSSHRPSHHHTSGVSFSDQRGAGLGGSSQHLDSPPMRGSSASSSAYARAHYVPPTPSGRHLIVAPSSSAAALTLTHLAAAAGAPTLTSRSSTGGGLRRAHSVVSPRYSSAAHAGYDDNNGILADAIARAPSMRGGGAGPSASGPALHAVAAPGHVFALGLTGWDGPVFGFEGTGPDALFAYVQRWLTLAGSALSLPLAVQAYARGEDGDVVDERRAVQDSVWPCVEAQLAQGGRRAGRGGSDRSSHRTPAGSAPSASSSSVAPRSGAPGRAHDSSLRLRKQAGDTSSSSATAAAAASRGDGGGEEARDLGQGEGESEGEGDTVFDRYPIIIRHLRKEFRVPKPRAPRAVTGWWLCAGGRGGGAADGEPDLGVGVIRTLSRMAGSAGRTVQRAALSTSRSLGALVLGGRSSGGGGGLGEGGLLPGGIYRRARRGSSAGERGAGGEGEEGGGSDEDRVVGQADESGLELSKTPGAGAPTGGFHSSSAPASAAAALAVGAVGVGLGLRRSGPQGADHHIGAADNIASAAPESPVFQFSIVNIPSAGASSGSGVGGGVIRRSNSSRGAAGRRLHGGRGEGASAAAVSSSVNLSAQQGILARGTGPTHASSAVFEISPRPAAVALDMGLASAPPPGSLVPHLSLPHATGPLRHPVPPSLLSVASFSAGGGAPASPSTLSRVGTKLDPEQGELMQCGVKVALSDLSLAVGRGTCLGLLGENGAGKTTAISMLSGMFPASAGDAFVGGYHIQTETDAVRTRIGICPQLDTLWPTLTVREHVEYYSRIRGCPEGPTLATEVDGALDRVGLSKLSRRFSRDLSGGQRRRLSLAIALCGNPAILFADEPTTGLDPATRRRVWRIIEEARPGRVVVLVSHDMGEVEILANRIGIMTFGRLRCLGDQQHLKRVYGGGYRLSINYAMDEEGDEGAGSLGLEGVPPPDPDAGGGGAGAAIQRLIRHVSSAESAVGDLEAEGGGGEGEEDALGDSPAATRALGAILRLFPTAILDSHFPGHAVFTLPDTAAPMVDAPPAASAQSKGMGTGAAAAPRSIALPISKVFQLMQLHAAAAGVTDWELALTSLDTIFSRIVQAYRGPGALK